MHEVAWIVPWHGTVTSTQMWLHVIPIHVYTCTYPNRCGCILYQYPQPNICNLYAAQGN